MRMDGLPRCDGWRARPIIGLQDRIIALLLLTPRLQSAVTIHEAMVLLDVNQFDSCKWLRNVADSNYIMQKTDVMIVTEGICLISFIRS